MKNKAWDGRDDRDDKNPLFSFCAHCGAPATANSPVQLCAIDGKGFLLHRDCWRQGLLREAMEALLPHYFGTVEEGGRGLGVVTADTDPRNEATLAFLHASGFETTGREERTFQVGGEGGEWADSVYLELRREVWLEREREREREKER